MALGARLVKPKELWNPQIGDMVMGETYNGSLVVGAITTFHTDAEGKVTIMVMSDDLDACVGIWKLSRVRSMINRALDAYQSNGVD